VCIFGAPGAGGHPGAGAVEGHVGGVGGEAGQDAVRFPVGKGMDLDRVVGGCGHQLALL